VSAVSRHVAWPADRFYWALLDPGHHRSSRRPDARRLGYLFEEFLPLDLEQVHAVYCPAGDGRWIACGVERRIAAELPQHVTSLVPESFPEFAPGFPGAVTMNVLTGDLEPASIRRVRRTTAIVFTVGVLFLGFFVAAGFLRRAWANERQLDMLDGLRASRITQALGPAANPDLSLLAALRQVRQTHVEEPDADNRLDAAQLMESLLRAWPADPRVQIETITVAPASIALTGLAPSSDVAADLAEKVRNVNGWTLQQPQFESRSQGVSFTIHLAGPEPSR
jgi:hypothetical protein